MYSSAYELLTAGTRIEGTSISHVPDLKRSEPDISRFSINRLQHEVANDMQLPDAYILHFQANSHPADACPATSTGLTLNVCKGMCLSRLSPGKIANILMFRVQSCPRLSLK
jgi:hypothetical protein